MFLKLPGKGFFGFFFSIHTGRELDLQFWENVEDHNICLFEKRPLGYLRCYSFSMENYLPTQDYPYTLRYSYFSAYVFLPLGSIPYFGSLCLDDLRWHYALLLITYHTFFLSSPSSLYSPVQCRLCKGDRQIICILLNIVILALTYCQHMVSGQLIFFKWVSEWTDEWVASAFRFDHLVFFFFFFFSVFLFFFFPIFLFF